MPKIEIELSEVEVLTARIEQLSLELEKADAKFHALDEEVLLSKAKEVARKLFRHYLTVAFGKLGFDEVQVGDWFYQGDYGVDSWFEEPERAQFVIHVDLVEGLTKIVIAYGLDERRVRDRQRPTLDAILEDGVTKP